MGRVTRARVIALVLAVSAAGCASGPSGLGKKACLYVRPRLVRIDKDRLAVASDPVTALADLSAVAQDFALYVQQLPAGGKARSDRALTTFSAALTTFAADGPSAAARLDPAETAIKRRCGVR